MLPPSLGGKDRHSKEALQENPQMVTKNPRSAVVLPPDVQCHQKVSKSVGVIVSVSQWPHWPVQPRVFEVLRAAFWLKEHWRCKRAAHEGESSSASITEAIARS